MKRLTEDPGANSWIGAALVGVGTVATGLFGWLKSRGDERKDLLQTSIARIEKLEAQMQSKSDEIKDLSAQLAASEATRRILQDEVAELTAQLQQLQADRDDLAAEVNSAREDLATTLEHVAALQQQVTALGEQPAPRPERQRDAGGRFAKQKGRKR